jgi:hypothetical protein
MSMTFLLVVLAGCPGAGTGPTDRPGDGCDFNPEDPDCPCVDRAFGIGRGWDEVCREDQTSAVYQPPGNGKNAVPVLLCTCRRGP